MKSTRMAACTCRFLIFGHSLCAHLHDRVLRRSPMRNCNRLSPSFDLIGSPQVEFHGVSGLKFSERLKAEMSVFDSVQPHVVFLQLGCNDVNRNTIPEELAWKLISFATVLCGRYGVKRVVLAKLMPRFEARRGARKLRWIRNRPRSYIHFYNKCAREVNAILHRELASYPSIDFWDFDRRFPSDRRSSCRRRFGDDGVHHSRRGIYHYYQSIRGALTSSPCFTQGSRHLSRK